MITLQPSGPTSGSVERVLRASKMFQGLGPALLGELASGSVRKRIGRGEALWREGDPATRFVLISSGLVKIVQRAADQTDCIIGFFGPREAVGTVAVLKKGRYPASAIASSDHVEYLSLEPKPLIAAMDTDPAAARAMSGALIHHTGALHEKIAVMSAGAVPQRLATQLLTLAERFGDELDDGTLSIPLVLSRGEMACLVGARVETTIRVLTSWQKRGVVELGRDGARILAPEELRAIARGAKTAAGAAGDDDALAQQSPGDTHLCEPAGPASAGHRRGCATDAGVRHRDGGAAIRAKPLGFVTAGVARRTGPRWFAYARAAVAVDDLRRSCDGTAPAHGDPAMALTLSLVRALSVSRVLGGVDLPQIEHIAVQTVHRRLNRGDVLFRAGEQATFLGIVTSGLVRIHRPAGDGDTMVAIFGPRETLGNLAVCDGGPYPVTAVAATDDTWVACVDANAICSLARRDLAAAQGMLRALSDHARALHSKIGIFAAGSIEQRLVALFLHLLERFGDQMPDGGWVIPVALTRGELAALVDATIETTIRTLSRWQKQGLLVSSRDGFVLRDPSALQARLEGSSEVARIAAA